MDINHWHRFAYMYLENKLDISEIVKFWIIAAAAGITEDDKTFQIGFNVLDNSELRDGLILGLIKAQPEGETITYRQIGSYIGRHKQTIGNAVKRMVEKGYINTEYKGVSGGIITVTDDSHLPQWIIKFTEAIVNIQADEALKKKLYEECKDIRFERGFQVFAGEILFKLGLKKA